MTMLEHIMGPPMAAPESRFMRRLRIMFTVLASTTAVSILLLDMLVMLLGRVATGGALAALITLTALTGTIFFLRKSRIDDRWILDRGFDCEGDGA
jgi:hypothetical protein